MQAEDSLICLFVHSLLSFSIEATGAKWLQEWSLEPGIFRNASSTHWLCDLGVRLLE